MTAIVVVLCLVAFPLAAIVLTLDRTITSNRDATRSARRAYQQTRLTRIAARSRW